MSVTFFPTTDFNTTLFAIACSCNDARLVGAFTYAAAYASIQGDNFVTPSCGDEFCSAYPASIIEFTPVVHLNVTSSNAKMLLDTLGVVETGDLTGEMDAEDFLGRILIALGVNPTDAGVPATRDGFWNTMGRNEGYTDARLLELEEVARYAVDNKLTVSWS